MKIVKYFYDRENLLSVHDSSLPFPLIYIHSEGIDDPVILRYGEKSYYFVKDHLGSVRKVIDSSGSVFNSYDYDSFGRPIDFTETIPSHFHFTGREFDQESGLYYYRARYYDSNTGRFLSEDPIGFLGGFNLYLYVLNNPSNFKDPFGLKDCKEKPRDCIREFFKCLGDCVFLPGFSSLIESGSKYIEICYWNMAWQHAASKGLIYPLRSSVVRSCLSISRSAGSYGLLGTILICEFYCLIREIQCVNEQ